MKSHPSFKAALKYTSCSERFPISCPREEAAHASHVPCGPEHAVGSRRGTRKEFAAVQLPSPLWVAYGDNIQLKCSFIPTAKISQGCHTARQLPRLVVAPAEILAVKEQTQFICLKSVISSFPCWIRESVLLFSILFLKN